MEDTGKPFKPSLVDVRTALTAAIAFAQLYGEANPSHRTIIAEFVTAITTLARELADAMYGPRPAG
jgi:hypothetical protein